MQKMFWMVSNQQDGRGPKKSPNYFASNACFDILHYVVVSVLTLSNLRRDALRGDYGIESMLVQSMVDMILSRLVFGSL